MKLVIKFLQLLDVEFRLEVFFQDYCELQNRKLFMND